MFQRIILKDLVASRLHSLPTRRIVNLSNLDFKKKKTSINQEIDGKHFDVAVIGGGSAGIAFCYEAYSLGLKTVLFDYVEPSTQGSKWGLGGTCANVGCIPKKLFHTAGLYKELIQSASGYGFNINNINEQNWKPEYFNWESLVQAVQSYIKGNNFGYKKSISQKNIPYINALASLKDPNTLVYSPNKKVIEEFLKDNNYTNKELLGKVTADYIIVAVGGRPQLLSEKQCKNMHSYAITSDDIFSQKNPPGKTLVVGGGYIGLECAGFLSSLQYPVSIMTRGQYLRSFDQSIVQMILDQMQKDNHVRIIPTSLPYEIQQVKEKQFLVKWKNSVNQEVGQEEFNTIIGAIGRKANTGILNLEKVGVKLHAQTKKVLGNHEDEREKSSVSNIYALGDVLEGIPELTPVASKSATLLAKRLKLKKSNADLKLIKKSQLNYEDVPTTIFTPLEYGCVGLSEQNAEQKFGKENIVTYHSLTTPLEENLSGRYTDSLEPIRKKSYFKVVCNKLDDERVVGMHYVGQNAGEIIQGYGVAFKMGLKKKDLDATVGIHPTTTEEFVNLKITRQSGQDPEKTSC